MGHLPYRCVVADDHPAIIDAVSRYLADVDDVDLVATAENDDEALRLVDEHTPEVAEVEGTSTRCSPPPLVTPDKGRPALTERERDLVRLLANGDRYNEIARALSLSTATVRKLTGRIKTKLGAATPIEAVQSRCGFLSSPS
jgi:DNA-binding NarL/FixJ family response regulator